MTEREQFEKAFPVPDGAVWWDVIEAYCRKNKTTVHQYNDKWLAWQAARATPPEGMAIVPVEFIQVLQDSQEINPCNYDHDQVCRLNTSVNEALAMLSAAKDAS